jgi:hypothetical protein
MSSTTSPPMPPPTPGSSSDEPARLDRLNPTAVAADARRTAFGRTDLPPEIAAILTTHHLLA